MRNVRHDFARALRRTMKRRKITELELSRRMGMSKQHLERRVLSTGSVTLGTVSRIADALDMRVVLKLERKP